MLDVAYRFDEVPLPEVVVSPQLAAKALEFIAVYRRARYRGEPADEHLDELARLE